MVNVVLFGGTFNPIHNGHMFMIKECINKLNPDKLIVIPTYTSPHKQEENKIDAVHRINMCKLALSGIQNVDISDYEIKNMGISYTYNTVTYFKKIYSCGKIYLLIGSDVFFTFKTWYKYKQILGMSTLAVMARNNESLYNLKGYAKNFDNDLIQGGVVLIDSSVPNISSTYVRQRIAENCKIEDMIPYEVKWYIDKHKLYI